jgi:hypothetical protein
MLRGGGTAIALALTGGLLAVMPSGPASAVDPASCPFAPAQTYTWKTTVSDGSWTLASGTNWDLPTTPGYPDNPNDRGNGPADPMPTYVCIGPNVTVHVDSNISSGRFINIRGMWLAAGAKLYIDRGAVFVDGQAPGDESFASPGSLIDVNLGWLGGMGTLRTKGLVTIHSTELSASTLGSNLVSDGAPLNAGTLHVDTGGIMRLPDFGVNFNQGYAIDVHGRVELLNHGYFGVEQNSALRIEPSGTLEFSGTSGFFESGGGGAISLVNNGTIIRSGGTNTSLIGTDYSQSPEAEVKVTQGKLAFAGGTSYSADVSGGQQLSTAKCKLLSANQGCVEETDPTADLQSVAFQTPVSDLAVVQVQELQQAATTLDSQGVGNVFLAHAAQLNATPANPAVLEFRVGTNVTGTPHLADLGITHVTDSSVTEVLPDCLPSGQPPTGTGCVDRRGLPGSSRIDGPNAYLVVRTTETSRYVCHKDDVTGPTLSGVAAATWKGLKKPIQVTARTDEPGKLAVGGTVQGKIRRKGKAKKVKIPLQAFTIPAGANQDTLVTMKLSKKQRSKLKGARKVKLLVTIAALDAAENTSPPQTVIVKLT